MSGGSYRGLLELFGMEQEDYKRLLNFLAAHDCRVEAREFRPAGARGRFGVPRFISAFGSRISHG